VALTYKYYRDSWIKLAILTIALSAFFWEYSQGRAQAEDGVVPLIFGIAILGHAFLIIMMIRAKKAEAEAKRILLDTIIYGSSRAAADETKK
jgi:hypothetical protein